MDFIKFIEAVEKLTAGAPLTREQHAELEEGFKQLTEFVKKAQEGSK